MGTKKLVRPIIIILLVITISISYVSVSAFTQSSDATAFLTSSCGMQVDNLLEFGTFYADDIPDEITTNITIYGTETSTISVIADNWHEGNIKSTGVITVTNFTPEGTDSSIFINGVRYFGHNHIGLSPREHHSTGDNNRYFQLEDDDDELSAQSFAHLINHLTVQDVTAQAVGNTVILTAIVPGVFGNNITMYSDNTTFTPDNDTLYGGGGVVIDHMLSSVTKYSVTTDGSSSAGIAYDEKIAFESENVLHTLTESASPNKNLSLSLQISGKDTLFNVPFYGKLFQNMFLNVACN